MRSTSSCGSSTPPELQLFAADNEVLRCIPATFTIALTHREYGTSLDLCLVSRLVNFLVWDGSTLPQAMKRSLQKGCLEFSNIIIKSAESTLTVANRLPNGLWLGHRQCCKEKPKITQISGKELLRCLRCHRMTENPTSIASHVMTPFMDTFQPRSAEIVIQHWVQIPYPQYYDLPIWMDPNGALFQRLSNDDCPK